MVGSLALSVMTFLALLALLIALLYILCYKRKNKTIIEELPVVTLLVRLFTSSKRGGNHGGLLTPKYCKIKFVAQVPELTTAVGRYMVASACVYSNRPMAVYKALLGVGAQVSTNCEMSRLLDF